MHKCLVARVASLARFASRAVHTKCFRPLGLPEVVHTSACSRVVARILLQTAGRDCYDRVSRDGQVLGLRQYDTLSTARGKHADVDVIHHFQHTADVERYMDSIPNVALNGYFLCSSRAAPTPVKGNRSPGLTDRYRVAQPGWRKGPYHPRHGR